MGKYSSLMLNLMEAELPLCFNGLIYRKIFNVLILLLTYCTIRFIHWNWQNCWVRKIIHLSERTVISNPLAVNGRQSHHISQGFMAHEPYLKGKNPLE